MGTKTYALVNGDGIIVNMISWDAEAAPEWKAPDGLVAVECKPGTIYFTGYQIGEIPPDSSEPA